MLARISISLSILASLFGSVSAQAARQTAVFRQVDPVAYPEAKCNDGTTAAYYARGAAPNGDISGNKWLIVLHGGGSCDSDLGCAERWFDPDANNGALDHNVGYHGNMTADPALLAATKNFDGQGILDLDGDPGSPIGNPFAGFNRIMVHYCSSDGWSGLGETRAIVTGPNTAAGVGLASYQGEVHNLDTVTNLPFADLTTLRFAGAKIVDAVVSIVMEGKVADGGSVGAVPLASSIPDAAGEIVLAGSSAGGAGTLVNLDAAQALATTTNSVPVWGIIDAASGVGLEPSPTGDRDFAQAQYYGGAVASPNVRLPGTCSLPGNQCYSGALWMQSYIESPYFVVQQSYDAAVHSAALEAYTAAVTANRATFCTSHGPVVENFCNTHAGVPDADVAEALIRSLITRGAYTIGTASNVAGLFIPNYILGKHQLMVENDWFFNDESNVTGLPSGGPRLGNQTAYPASPILGSLPEALDCFRLSRIGRGSCVAGIGTDVGVPEEIVNTTTLGN